MLSDNDRIFTNLYGMNDRSLKGAQRRGHWDQTGRLMKKGRDWIIDEIKASGLRGRAAQGFQLASNGHLCLKKATVDRLIWLLMRMNLNREHAKIER